MNRLVVALCVALVALPSWAWEMGDPIVTYWAGPVFPGNPEKLTERAAQQLKEGGFNVVWTSLVEEMDVARCGRVLRGVEPQPPRRSRCR